MTLIFCRGHAGDLYRFDHFTLTDGPYPHVGTVGTKAQVFLFGCFFFNSKNKKICEDLLSFSCRTATGQTATVRRSMDLFA